VEHRIDYLADEDLARRWEPWGLSRAILAIRSDRENSTRQIEFLNRDQAARRPSAEASMS
jgi:hypothetical protein